MSEDRSLSALLRRDGPWSPRRALDLVVQLTHALQRGRFRGAIAPSAIRLEGDTARLAEPTGAISPGFRAPELRLDGAAETPAADIYALTALLFHLVTGQTPADLHLAPADSPRWDDLPQPLRPVVREGLNADPAGRLDVEALRHRLEAVRPALVELPPRSVAAVPTPEIAPVVAELRSRRSRPMASAPRAPGRWLLGGAAALVVVLGSVGALVGPYVSALPELAPPTALPVGEWRGHLNGSEPLRMVVRPDATAALAIDRAGAMLTRDEAGRWTAGDWSLQLVPHGELPQVRVGWLRRPGKAAGRVVLVWSGSLGDAQPTGRSGP